MGDALFGGGGLGASRFACALIADRNAAILVPRKAPELGELMSAN
jgi:hypothetical protein